MRFALIAGLVGLVFSSGARGGIVISEYMYNGTGAGGEFVEFTNTTQHAIDMTGWSYDDDSRLPGTVSLSGFGLVQPGASVVLAEDDVAEFEAAWGLAGVYIVGSNTTNLGRNDEINLFEENGALVDRLTYGDQNFPGSFRADKISSSGPPAVLGTNNILPWAAAVLGDIHGAHLSTNGHLGSPGRYVPEPAALCLLGFGTCMLARRRDS